jgi:hypothetical protein
MVFSKAVHAAARELSFNPSRARTTYGMQSAGRAIATRQF